ncbi:MAG: ABC transporter permease subunit [Bacteroidetes bacterium]|jgi:Cu-processing system permease protein|nr:ABC transporter permease subunit [Bacteroidota bacterium]
MLKISAVILQNLLRNKAIFGYLVLLCFTGWGMFLYESQPEKAVLSILQIVLLVLPLITLIFTTTYYYHSQEFLFLLLAQPIKRSDIFAGLYIGLAIAFLAVFFIGIGLPVLLFASGMQSLFLLLSGLLLNLVFIAIALLVGVGVHDKSRGIGVTLITWAFFAFIYNGLVIFMMYQLSDYPIENLILVLSFLNPVDIARIMVIMKSEASALLGLSGAVFQDFFGTAKGGVVSILALILWSIIPFWITHKMFRKRDL